jgi:hypothetical protein
VNRTDMEVEEENWKKKSEVEVVRRESEIKA